MKEQIEMLCKERPVGSINNTRINDYLENELLSYDYKIESLPFSCNVWNYNTSHLSIGTLMIDLNPSPFSESFEGEGNLLYADSIEALACLDCTNSILLLSGSLTQRPLQPKDFPFYYPDEDKQLITMLEKKAPLAIIAFTDRQPLCGLSPFPLFEDGNFLIPSAYVSSSTFALLKSYIGTTAHVTIASSKQQVQSRQLIGTKNGTSKDKRFVICAHLDSKYNTPGALDNAAGIAVLLETARRLVPSKYSIDIVPFNGEEYYEASGELGYLQYLENQNIKVELLINIDSPCHIHANTAVSFYNFDEIHKSVATNLFKAHPSVSEGEQWYAGDHSAYVFAGTPCVAVTSSDLFTGGLEKTHTPNDTIDCIDTDQVIPIAEYIVALVNAFEAIN